MTGGPVWEAPPLPAFTQINPDHGQESPNKASKSSCSQSGAGGGFFGFLWVTWQNQKDAGPQSEGTQVLKPLVNTGKQNPHIERHTETQICTQRDRKGNQGWPPHIHTPVRQKDPATSHVDSRHWISRHVQPLLRVQTEGILTRLHLGVTDQATS